MPLPRVDTGCFPQRYNDFGHTNLGVRKFNLKKNIKNYHYTQFQFFDQIRNIMGT